MSHYTPGPWNIHTLPDGSHHIMSEHWGASVAVTMYPDNGEEGRKSNARLIAAAPDMLKALELIQKRAARNDQPSAEWLNDFCSAVINQAKGV